MKKNHFPIRTPRPSVAFEPDENGFWYHPDFRWDIVPDESPATQYFKDVGYDLHFAEMADDHPNFARPLECTKIVDDKHEECPNCHGDGRDPWNDYLLPCPLCS